MARILCVDDEANHLRVLAIGLGVEGFEVETASSAEEAIRAVGHLDVDLVLVDLMMPGTNGLDLARALRRTHPSLPVVLTSAYHLSEGQLRRVDCGAVGFVPKPYILRELAAFLRAKLTSASAALASPRDAAALAPN